MRAIDIGVFLQSKLTHDICHECHDNLARSATSACHVTLSRPPPDRSLVRDSFRLRYPTLTVSRRLFNASPRSFQRSRPFDRTWLNPWRSLVGRYICRAGDALVSLDLSIECTVPVSRYPCITLAPKSPIGTRYPYRRSSLVATSFSFAEPRLLLVHPLFVCLVA